MVSKICCISNLKSWWNLLVIVMKIHAVMKMKFNSSKGICSYLSRNVLDVCRDYHDELTLVCPAMNLLLMCKCVSNVSFWVAAPSAAEIFMSVLLVSTDATFCVDQWIQIWCYISRIFIPDYVVPTPSWLKRKCYLFWSAISSKNISFIWSICACCSLYVAWLPLLLICLLICISSPPVSSMVL